MSDQSKFVYNAFRGVYWIGLLSAIFLAFTQPWAGLLPPLFDEKWTFTLLVVSVSHVLLLAGMGFLLKWDGERTYYVHAGGQVQTAGYLHTLIGFGAALLVFDPGGAAGPGQLNLTEVLYPIGSALLTSILGWFFGGEIVGRDAREEPEVVARDQLLDLVDHLESFMERARDRHQAYVDALESIVETQNTLRERQQSVLIDTTEMAETVTSTLEGLDDTAARIDDHLTSVASSLQEGLNAEQLQESLHGIHDEAKSLNEGLGETSDHVSAVNHHLRESRESAKKTLENLDQFASDAPEVHERYTSQLQKARDEIREVVEVVEEVLEKAHEDAETLEEAPEVLAPVREATQKITEMLGNIETSVREVDTAVQRVQRSIGGMNDTEDRVKEALEEVGDTAQRMTTALGQTRDIIDDMIEERYYDEYDPA